MKIYTRTGDDGLTSVIGGRVGKDDTRVAAYGTIDELNCLVGVVVSLIQSMEKFDDLTGNLLQIQHELFDCGSDLAYARRGGRDEKVTGEMIQRLETWIDLYQNETPPLRRFILPGGSLVSAQLHVCRTVCRRAERMVVTLAKEAEVNVEVQKYLNRLSDYFFTVARMSNAREDISDVEYVRGADVFRINNDVP